jgi:membrane protease YdiL (CAAX protease family)
VRSRWDGPAGRVAAALGRRPLAGSAAVVASLAAVRTVDVLALGLHVRLGTLAPSAVAMLLAGATLAPRVDGEAGGSLALDRRSLAVVLAVGVAGAGAVQVAARAAEVAALVARGLDPVLVVRLENPATTTTDPLQVGAYLAFGVVVTAVGEELLFRRALLSALAADHGFWRANAVQAALFGAWHFAWPLAYAVSPAEPYPPLWLYGGSLLVVTATVGLLFGWLARTTNLWTVVAAHLLHNLAAVVLHVRTAGGDVRGSLVAATVVVGYLLLALAAER